MRGSSTKEPPLFIVSPPLSPLRCGVDAWILAQGRPPINKKSQRLWPVVRERMILSDSLARYLTQLGLERRTPEGENLTDYIEARYSDGGGDSGG